MGTMTQLKGTEMRIGRDWSLDGRRDWSLEGRCGSRVVCGGRDEYCKSRSAVGATRIAGRVPWWAVGRQGSCGSRQGRTGRGGCYC